jgi:hypothetical protein
MAWWPVGDLLVGAIVLQLGELVGGLDLEVGDGGVDESPLCRRRARRSTRVAIGDASVTLAS